MNYRSSGHGRPWFQLRLILSGDNSRVIERTTSALDIPFCHARGNISPEEKSHWIEFLQRTKFDPKLGESKNRKVMFVGDGTNDTLALVQADADVSLGGGTDVSSSAALVVLLSSLHTGLLELFSLVLASRRRAWINFAWAGVYNAVATLSACGLIGRAHIPPWWAGLGELVSVLPTVLVAWSLGVVRWWATVWTLNSCYIVYIIEHFVHSFR